MNGPLPMSTCPTCGYQVDAATHPVNDKAVPKPGDLSLCMKCGELMTFNDDMTLRLSSIEDVMGLKPEENNLLERTQKLIREKRPMG